MEISWLEYALLASDVYDAPPKFFNKQWSIVPNINKEVLDQRRIELIDRARNQAYKKLHEARMQTSLIARGWQVLHEHPAEIGDGFFARLYGNDYTRNTVTAYRGTVVTEIENLVADIKLWLKKPSSMLEKARDFYDSVKDNIKRFQKNSQNYSKKIYFTGHSLGGYLAQYIAVWQKSIQDEVAAVVFNAPKLGKFEDEFVHYVDPHKSYPYIINIDLDYDQIHTVGTAIGIQHILHGDESCSPDFLNQLRIQPSLYPQASFAASAGQLVYCFGHEHSMDTMSKTISTLREAV